MMLKIFVEENDPHAMELAVKVMFGKIFYKGTPDGDTEAAHHSVLYMPSAVLVDDQNLTINRWIGHLPLSTEVENYTI